MRHSAAILGIMLLLLLSGCRPVGEGGSGSTPPVQRPEVSPTASAGTPEPTPTPEPMPDTDPPQGGDQIQETSRPEETQGPTALTAEELSAYALEWSETYASRFAGYDAFHIDHGYWFAEYAGAAAQIAFTAADGADGTVFFLPADAAPEPAAAAALLLGQEEQSLTLVDRNSIVEEMARRMASMAAENLTEEAALDLYLKSARYVPALTEDMWYCVDSEDRGYILMSYQGAYRFQRMAAMTEYAAMPVFRVRIDFDRAAEAYGWFYKETMPPGFAAGEAVEGEKTYCRIEYPGISSMLELRTYLKTVFSDEIVDALLGMGYYRDEDGVLFGLSFTSADWQTPQGPGAVIQESPTRVIYRLESDYVYELVGEQWLFTQFPAGQ